MLLFHCAAHSYVCGGPVSCKIARLQDCLSVHSFRKVPICMVPAPQA